MGSAASRRTLSAPRHALRLTGAVLAALATVTAAGAAHATLPVAHPDTATGTVVLDGQNQPAGHDPTRATGPGLYLVTLTGEPAATYAGGVAGLAATLPRPGTRFDRTRPAVAAYEAHLRAEQDRVLSAIGDPPTTYRYTTAANGFAAELTTSQVKRLRAMSGVALVERSTKQQLASVSTPDYLGLTGADGVWRRHGGTDEAGKGVVVGVIDSGIWPENPSFAGVPTGAPGESQRAPGFHGACQRGEQWTADDCDDKVLSARYFVAGFGEDEVAKSEYLSPRDGSGHGSHTAAIAAGNSAVEVSVGGQSFGHTSGMAPAAQLAVYKACWTAPNPDDDGCTTADTVAAIDQAVADGVDVISYSIAGPAGGLAGSVSLAFLRAAEAGVFVAAPAGNTGPEPGTVGHPGPWVTTVGASTHQLLQGAVVLGDGRTYVGAMVADQDVPRTRLVLGSDAAAATATPESARLCEIGSLDAARVQDTIVVCERGVTARVDKSEAVARAGGAGMILVNTHPDSVESDVHAVPSVHVDSAAGTAIEAYVDRQGADATAALDAQGAEDVPVPQIAGFSARGPSPAADGDLLKPDLTAPGVSIVSAVAPPSDTGRLFDLASGTSMSTPHVAGLAALAHGVHPDWSPAEIKSAMMTTARALEDDAGPFAEGAGQVQPRAFLDPVLVYDAGGEDWRGFLTGLGLGRRAGSSATTTPVAAGDLNLPSIAVGDLTGSRQVTRTVTNVSDRPETFEADVSGLDGIAVTVAPEQILLRPGQSATFTVTLRTLPGAQPGTYTEGTLTWTGLTGEATIPVVVRPEVVDAPTEVSAASLDGSVTVRGRSGTDGSVAVGTTGLAGALPTPVSLVPGAFDPDDPDEGRDSMRTSLSVPAGAEVLRVAMDAHNGADDLDVFVYHEGELVAASADDSADETVTLVRPEEGQYDVYVSSYAAANGSATTGQLYTWVVGSADTGNLTLDREAVDVGAGDRFRLTASWDPDQLDLTQRWFGVISYGPSDDHTFLTLG